MSVDISTSIAGVKMRSPLGVAAMLPSMNRWYPDTPLEDLVEKIYQKWLDNGVGYLKACTISPGFAEYDRVNYGPIVQVAPGVHGYYTAMTYKIVYRPQEVLPIIDVLKELSLKNQDVPLICTITAPTLDTKPWSDMAKLVEDRGADLIELNTFAPCETALLRDRLPPEDAKWGTAIGSEPRILGPIVEAVAKAVKIPVGVKLTPDAGYPGILKVLDVCSKGGARFVDMFHQTFAVAPPDIYNDGKGPYLTTDGWNPVGTMGGEWNVYHSFKGAVLTSMHFPELEIFSGGGITQREQVIQNIMFGARAVETMSGIFFRGNPFLRQSLKFLKNYMEMQGYQALEDFRGIGMQYITTGEESYEKTKHLKFIAETDEAKCTGCGLCVEAVCPASYIEDRIGKIDPGRCNGCGLCLFICPEGARKIVPAK